MALGLGLGLGLGSGLGSGSGSGSGFGLGLGRCGGHGDVVDAALRVAVEHVLEVVELALLGTTSLV